MLDKGKRYVERKQQYTKKHQNRGRKTKSLSNRTGKHLHKEENKCEKYKYPCLKQISLIQDIWSNRYDFLKVLMDSVKSMIFNVLSILIFT